MSLGEAIVNRVRLGAKVIELRDRVKHSSNRIALPILQKELALAEIDYSIALGVEDTLTPDWIVVANGFIYNSRPRTYHWHYLSMTKKYEE